MTSTRLVLSTLFFCLTTLLTLHRTTCAKIITLNLDSNQSILQLSIPFENMNGDVLQLQPQAPGTLAASFTGTATVDVLAGEISVLVHAEAITFAGTYYPYPPDGPSPGPGPADLAGRVVNSLPNEQVLYAVRDLVVDIGSLPTPLTPAGSFSVSNHVVAVSGERSYFAGSVSPDGSVGSGFVGIETNPFGNTNHSLLMGSFDQVGNQYTLTIPVEIPWPINMFSAGLPPGTGTLQGQLVAIRTVPEPSSLALAFLGIAVTLLAAGRLHK